MEKLNSVRRFPVGFRFQPTDEELVVHYLKRKVQSYPLPASIIHEADVFKSDPWNLSGDSEHERFFFGLKETKHPNGNKFNRATESGYWKSSGLDKQIIDSESKQVIGMKKYLVFYTGKRTNGSKTNWVMHEYRLAGPTQDMEKWVICKVFLKKRATNDNENDEIQEKIPVFYDFMAAARNDSSSSSYGSSGITKAC